MEALKTTLECLRQRRPIPGGTGAALFEEELPRSTFEVLCLIHSLALLPYQPCAPAVLEQLAATVASLTTLPPPLAHLIHFRKDLFYQQCADDRLLSKIYGLFPPTDLRLGTPLLLQFEAACGGEQVGNPNWLLTRSLVWRWAEAARELEEEALLSCDILLARGQLLERNGWGLWERLWARLYLCLTHLFLKPHLPPGRTAVWHELEPGELLRQLVALEDDLDGRPTQEVTLFKLVRFVVEEYLVCEGEGYFPVAASHTDILSSPTWQRLLTMHLLQEVAAALSHDRIAQNFQELVQNAVQTLPPDSSPELEYLLPHLLPHGQIQSYILERRLEFWRYGLGKSIEEDIAKAYLQDLSAFTEEQRGLILLHLPRDYFVEEVMVGRGLEQRRRKAIMRTLLRCADSMANRLHRFLEMPQEVCSRELRTLGEQWEAYHELQLAVDATSLDSAMSFLSFDRSTLSPAFQIKARFPQQSPGLYAQVLHRLTEYLLIADHQSLHTLLQDFVFLTYFEKLGEQARDELWRKWAELLLRGSASELAAWSRD